MSSRSRHRSFPRRHRHLHLRCCCCCCYSKRAETVRSADLHPSRMQSLTSMACPACRCRALSISTSAFIAIRSSSPPFAFCASVCVWCPLFLSREGAFVSHGLTEMPCLVHTTRTSTKCIWCGTTHFALLAAVAAAAMPIICIPAVASSMDECNIALTICNHNVSFIPSTAATTSATTLIIIISSPLHTIRIISVSHHNKHQRNKPSQETS